MRIHPGSRRRGLAVLLAAIAVALLILIHAFSSWYLGQNLALEVAVAEASQVLHLACDSAVEESVEGFVRSAAVRKETLATPEEASAFAFSNSMRGLQPGQAANTRFVPKNTRKSSGGMGVELTHVSMRAVQERAKPQAGKPTSEACQKLTAVIDKWSKIKG